MCTVEINRCCNQQQAFTLSYSAQLRPRFGRAALLGQNIKYFFIDWPKKPQIPGDFLLETELSASPE